VTVYSSKSVRIGLVQHACTADKAANVERCLQGIRAAAAGGAQIVVTQELFASLYFCQEENYAHFDLAETVPGPTSDRLAALAAELGVVIVGSLFERRTQGLYHNTAVVFDADGACLGKYRKMHIPDDPLFYEKFYFTPGDLGFKSFRTRFADLGVLVCWDQWFPEAARLAALQGAQILLYPTAIGWHPAEKARLGAGQYTSWETIQRAHGIANGCFVAAVNRPGHEIIAAGGIEFWGQSFVSDPSGTVLARAGAANDEVLVADLDLAAIEERRTHWPFLRDRRIDAYGALTKRFIDE
jgi:N-carbamoylputrescine amidase